MAMKAAVFSLGCKVNQYEGQSLISELIARGIDACDKLEYADCYIINTCSVTAEADRKSRQAVARALKFNPHADIYICGCSSQNNPLAFADKPNVRVITGAGYKRELIDAIVSGRAERENIVKPPPKEYEENALPSHTKTRAYIKVQDGCNNFCSYCIIPYLRGRSRSRSLDAVANEAEEAAKYTEEIVVTGIDVSSYGKDIDSSLTELIRALGKISVRKRIGSLECTAVNEELLYTMADCGFCDHFHLSLQSGSDSVLRRMNRHYDTDFYYAQTEKIRKIFPEAGITTDVIAGFAGETEEEHRQTVDFVKKVRFSDMHVFPYSERKGTKAYSMPQIDKSLRASRALELIAVGDEMREEFCKAQIGKTYEVYAETDERGESAGYTSNYIKVYSDAPIGEISEVKIEKLYKEGVQGKKL